MSPSITPTALSHGDFAPASTPSPKIVKAVMLDLPVFNLRTCTLHPLLLSPRAQPNVHSQIIILKRVNIASFVCGINSHALVLSVANDLA